jgi:hypothetical protein
VEEDMGVPAEASGRVMAKCRDRARGSCSRGRVEHEHESTEDYFEVTRTRF